MTRDIRHDDGTDRDATVEPHDGGLWAYIRHGPDAGGNDVKRRILGLYLYWRMWALLPAFALPVALSHAAVDNGFDPWVAGFLAGAAVLAAASLIWGGDGA